jgi:hypothetical protein
VKTGKIIKFLVIIIERQLKINLINFLILKKRKRENIYIARRVIVTLQKRVVP